MADVVINTVVKAPDTSALSAIKKELKEMKSLALNGDGVAAKRVAELTDKLEDLKDETQSLKGSGVEKLTNSFSLLKDGLGSFDTDKIKTGFKGIGGAMGAIPILALIEGIKLLIENFDVVVDFLKSFTSEAQANAKAVKELNAAYSEVNQNLQEADERLDSLTKNGEQRTKLAIEQAKRRGASEAEINKLELDGTKNKLESILKAEDFYRKNRDFTSRQLEKAQETGNEEAIKKATELYEKSNQAFLATQKSRHDQERALELEKSANQTEDQKAREESYKKHQEDLLRIRKESLKTMNESITAEDLKVEEFNNTKREEATAKLDEAENTRRKEAREKKEKDDKEASDKAIALAKLEAKTKLDIENQSIQAVQSLAESFFAFQLRGAEGNEKKQTEIKKRAFEVNKAFQIGQAIIDGARATLSAFATAPPGFKIAAAIAAGAFAIAQIVKISSAKFNPGSGSSSSSLSPVSGGGGGGGSSNPSNPALPSSNTQPQQNTTFDDNGNKTGGTNWISVKEINATQRRVNRVTEQARF